MSASDELILLALVTGKSQTDAALTAGVSEKTVRRRLAEPEFAQALRIRRDEVVREVTAGLTSLSRRSVATVAELMEADASFPLTNCSL